MQEHQVTIGDQTFPAPAPFLVMATQNPIESEGVYPLPEAQRDRFMMRVPVGYPTVDEEREIVRRMDVERVGGRADPRPGRRARHAEGGGRRVRRPEGRRLRPAHRHRHPPPRRRRDAAARRAHRVRGQPPGQHRPHPGCPGDGAAPGSRLRTAPGRLRDRLRRAQPPAGAVVRGARRRGHRRRRPRRPVVEDARTPDHGDRGAHLGDMGRQPFPPGKRRHRPRCDRATLPISPTPRRRSTGSPPHDHGRWTPPGRRRCGPWS